jgi:hypothetical protein
MLGSVSISAGGMNVEPQLAGRPFAVHPRTVTFLLLAAAVAALLLYAATARAVLDQDPFVMGEVASQLLSGKRLYAEVWDNKAPLTLFFFAVPLWLAPHSYLAVQLFAGLCALIGGAVVLLFTRGAPNAARLGAAAVIVLGPLSRFEYAWASSEDASNLFVTVVLFASLRLLLQPEAKAVRDAFVAGAATTLALHARQSALVFGVLPLVAVALRPGRTPKSLLQGALAVGAGALAAWAVVLGLVALVGDVRGYFQTVFLMQRKYVGAPGEMIEFFGFIRNDALTLLIVLCLVLLALGRRLVALAFALALLLVGVLCIVMPMRSHLHYWEQLIPVAAALTFLTLASRKDESGRGRACAVALGLFLAGNAAWTAAKCVLRPTTREYHAIAQELRALAPAGGTLHVVGPESGVVYFASDLPNASPFFWDFYLFGVPQLLPRPVAEITAALERTPPDLLVVHDSVLTAIRGAAAGQLNTAWELVRRLLDTGRFQPAGGHDHPAARFRYFKLRG